LKRILVLAGSLAFGVAVGAGQLSMIVLKLDGAQGKVPPGWQIKVNRGQPEITVGRGPDGDFMKLRSDSASYGLERAVDVDPDDLPYLLWRWKVTQLPAGGDFRRSRTDDQAAQILVAFADRRVIAYLWDTSAPKGTMAPASSVPLIHVFAIVCQSGSAAANRWIGEARNLKEDYQRAYGRPAPHVKGVRLQINSQHTGTTAESCFGELSFRKTPS
jgi:hypothetical protein